jgi:hypothetical protein
MTTLRYTIVTPLKNTVIERKDITNFIEKERGFYYEWHEAKLFVNWSYVAEYLLIEEQE